MSQVQQCKTHQSAKEVGLKLGFWQIKIKKTYKIPTDNYPIQRLVNMSLSPSRPSSSERKMLSGNSKILSEKFLIHMMDPVPDLMNTINRSFNYFLIYFQVKAKQESELKLKSFAPPYALQSELYLLPIMDHLGNIYSASSAVSLDVQQTNNGVAEADGIIHRPLSVTLSKEEPGTDPSCLENTLKKLLNKNQEEAGGKATPNEHQTGNNQIGNSELPGSQEDSDNDYFSGRKSQFLWKNEDDRTNIIRREDNQLAKRECISLPDLIDFPSVPCQPALSPGITDISLLQIESKILSKKMKQVKEERRYLERIKEELIKKVERLLEQGKLKQYHAYDVWKKKYFETKKVTASLEEILTKLREDLELYYKKLLIQLEARVIKMRPKNLATITDSKMRKQAVSELRTLKAELAQKKFITSFQSQ
ncbi:spermatogenesis-associated protein 1 [Globicephala melas]|uniref:spermatogenesis-associated protein 1 n=1 Tax=Globicephala melas TaxID=9731 RepID=UPI003873826D